MRTTVQDARSEPRRAARPMLLCILSRDAARVQRWTQLFASQGWPVETAESAEAALSLAGACRAGLGLADLALVPNMADLKRRVPHWLWIVVGSAGPADGPETV